MLRALCLPMIVLTATFLIGGCGGEGGSTGSLSALLNSGPRH